MYLLEGKPLALDRSFSHGGVAYPSNWLRLASPAEREAIGITEVPDPPKYDERFYWGFDRNGDLIPKDHADLEGVYIGKVVSQAYSLLQSTDWMIVREMETGTAVEAWITAWRQSVRNACEEKKATLMMTTTTDELATYVTHVSSPEPAPTDFIYWPPFVEPAPADTQVTGG